MCRFALLIVLAVATLSSIARGQFRAHDWEFTLAAAATNDKNFDDFGLGGSASIGYFLTDNLELSLRETASYTSIGGTSATTSDTQLAGDFHVALGGGGRIQPFVGGNVGYNYTDFSTDVFEAGPEVGAKFFVNNTTFIFALAEYEIAFSGGGSSSDDNQFEYRIGIGFRF